MKSNLGALALAIALYTQTALAQGDLLGADEMAEAIISMTSRVWTGPRTPAPQTTFRPHRPQVTLRSSRALVAVHADPDVSTATARQALRALEHARSTLDARGWPQPISDGGLGGGPEVDLYLTSELASGPYADGVVPWTYLDRVSAFAVLAPSTPSSVLDACVSAAYAQALLLSADPAEADAWRRATAAWLTWEMTGRFGCSDAVHEQQAQPYRSWITGGAGGGAGGAMWLAYLSSRHDGREGHFVRDVWALARQRTWEGEGLRAEPDLWAALETAISLGGDRLHENVEDFAVLRWFVGRGSRPPEAIAGIDSDAMVPVTRRMTRLPSRVTSPVALQPHGSAYVTLDRSVFGGAPTLRAWLRGEYGVRWSFVVVQLDEKGDEVRRIAAPQTGVSPKAYLPVELDAAADRVLFVVTNLSGALPDADEPDGNERGFELTVDRGG